MVADKTFTCTVLTPERKVLETAATFAAIPAYDGEVGILHDRAPLLCRLGVGILRLDTPAGAQRIFVDAGFAEMLDNRLTVLTEPRFAVPPAFATVVARTFSQRRKTLRNSLRGMVDAAGMAAAGLDPAARPETLHPEQFAQLARLAESHPA